MTATVTFCPAPRAWAELNLFCSEEKAWAEGASSKASVVNVAEKM